MLQTDIRHDVVRSFYRPLRGLDAAAVAAAFSALEEEGAELLEAEGVAAGARYFVRSADMRYVGQEYSVSVAVGDEVRLDGVGRAFHEAHRTRYGHSTPDAPVEFVNLRVAAMGRIAAAAAPFRAAEEAGDPLLDRRPVVFDATPHDTAVLRRDRLAARIALRRAAPSSSSRARPRSSRRPTPSPSTTSATC